VVEFYEEEVYGEEFVKGGGVQDGIAMHRRCEGVVGGDGVEWTSKNDNGLWGIKRSGQQGKT